MKPEVKLWHELKRNTNKIIWTRLENRSLFGTPDLLGYPVSGNFFTVELKVAKGNRIIFSPHQISFHMKHNFEYIYSCCLSPGQGEGTLVPWIGDPEPGSLGTSA